jgi:hypothetical protein
MNGGPGSTVVIVRFCAHGAHEQPETGKRAA